MTANNKTEAHDLFGKSPWKRVSCTKVKRNKGKNSPKRVVTKVCVSTADIDNFYQ